MQKYKLTSTNHKPAQEVSSAKSMFRRLITLIGKERNALLIALFFIFINASLNLIAPFLIGDAVDRFIVTGQYDGVIRYAIILLSIFVTVILSGYIQTRLMGNVGQRMLFNLRNMVFTKLQDLPFAFFTQNASGDLISRINSDTDKINQFFSQSLVQFMSSLISMTGAAIFLLSLNLPLGVAALLPGLVLFFFTRSISPWIKRRNAESMQSAGMLSASIQESLQHFKVIVAFNRRDFFISRFEEVNAQQHQTAIKAGIANQIPAPVYGLLANIGQLVVLSFGIYLILAGSFSVGLLISFLSYIVLFYNPLRQIAALWANFQVALAGWDRISGILAMESDMEILESADTLKDDYAITFDEVTFAYEPGNDILKHISFQLERGKTYAFVGPTGGGKTTIASLMARLYDPSSGRIMLGGQDLRTLTPQARAEKIGFILQEPFLFSGSLYDNIVYGNPYLSKLSEQEVTAILQQSGMDSLLQRFNGDLNTQISGTGEGISLGQRQLIAFIRAVIRKPDLLILDEATANVDTVTEHLLEDMLQHLPSSTTLIVIAHRLSTIEDADAIFFVNTGTVTKAGSMQDAVDMLMQQQRER